MSEGTEGWIILGIEPTQDADRIRRAYARRVKDFNPEEDPKGFLRLRAAYEAALQSAGRLSFAHVAPPTPASPVPAPEGASAGEPRSSQQAPATKQLQHEVRAFASLLVSQEVWDSAAAEASLQLILRSPALEDVNIQIRIERTLAELLLRAGRRADSLLPQVADRFRWEGRSRVVGTDPLIVAGVERVHQLQMLSDFESRTGRQGMAWRLLTGKWRPLWNIALVLGFGIDFEVRRLLREIAAKGGELHDLIDEDSVHRWQRFTQRQMGWISMTRYLLLFYAVIFLLSIGKPAAVASVVTALGIAVYGVYVAVFRAHLLPYLRMRFAKQQAQHFSRGWLFGWHFLAIGVLWVSTLLPGNLPALTLSFAASVAALCWCITAVNYTGAPPEEASINQRFWRIAFNIPILVCWYIMTQHSAQGSAASTWLPLLLMLVAYERGRIVLLTQYHALLAPTVHAVLALLMITAAVALFFFFYHAPTGPIGWWVLAVPIIMVILQRTPALLLDEDLHTLRTQLAMGAGWMGALSGPSGEKVLLGADWPGRACAIWLLLLVVATQIFVLMSLFGRWRSAREA